MNPIFILVALGAGVTGWLLLHRKKEIGGMDRATAMQYLADVIYRLAVKAAVKSEERQLAIDIAKEMFGLTKTAQGISTGAGMPTDENWPGTTVSVAAYMMNYVNQRRALPAKPKTYNDPAPIPPFGDPRPIRAQAIAAEHSNPAQAKLLHAKADVLSKLINSKKSAQTTQAKGRQILSAAAGLLNLKK